MWSVLSNLFPGRARGHEANHYLTKAYRDVFSGNATQEQAQVVLADLADSSGYYQTLGPGCDVAEYAESNGRRTVFGRIRNFLSMSDAELRNLEEAARQETLASRNMTNQGMDVIND